MSTITATTRAASELPKGPDDRSRVKDLGLAAWGRREIELAEVEMPGLMTLREHYKGTLPLKGCKISGSLHMTIQTAVLVETLETLGAKVRWCSCNIFSTQDHAAAAVASRQMSKVFAWKGMSYQDYWLCLDDTLRWPGGSGPDMIVDDGGDMTLFIHKGREIEILKEQEKKELRNRLSSLESLDEREMMTRLLNQDGQESDRFRTMLANLKGVSEETTTGIHRVVEMKRQGKLLCNVIDVNSSVTKSKFDNIYGCRHSLPDGIMRATDVMIAGKRVCICGYGDVGKGCAQAMKNAGARVTVTEIDPICALQALMEGFSVDRVDNLVETYDMFITCTGNRDIITALHMSQMKNNAIVGNIGHFDNEIEVAGLPKMSAVRHEIKPQVDRWVFPDGHGVLILAEGRLLNLGCGTGHPSFVMSMSFTNQVMAQITLNEMSSPEVKASLELVVGTDTDSKPNTPQVYKFPRIKDELVARLHLKALGAELTVLSNEQAQYTHLAAEGPYKNASYRY